MDSRNYMDSHPVHVSEQGAGFDRDWDQKTWHPVPGESSNPDIPQSWRSLIDGPSSRDEDSGLHHLARVVREVSGGVKMAQHPSPETPVPEKTPTDLSLHGSILKSNGDHIPGLDTDSSQHLTAPPSFSPTLSTTESTDHLDEQVHAIPSVETNSVTPPTTQDMLSKHGSPFGGSAISDSVTPYSSDQYDMSQQGNEWTPNEHAPSLRPTDPPQELLINSDTASVVVSDIQSSFTSVPNSTASLVWENSQSQQAVTFNETSLATSGTEVSLGADLTRDRINTSSHSGLLSNLFTRRNVHSGIHTTEHSGLELTSEEYTGLSVDTQGQGHMGNKPPLLHLVNSSHYPTPQTTGSGYIYYKVLDDPLLEGSQGTEYSNLCNGTYSGPPETVLSIFTLDNGANGYLYNLSGQVINCTNYSIGLPEDGDYGYKNPLLGLLLSMFAVITITGNILVMIAVARERYLRTVTNYFIVSLAIADLIIGEYISNYLKKKAIGKFATLPN